MSSLFMEIIVSKPIHGNYCFQTNKIKPTQRTTIADI